MSVGQRLKQLRGKAGLSQAQLAKLAGISRNAVSQWESGETQPATRHLAVIARALKVPVDALIAPATQHRQHVVDTALRLFARLDAEVVTVEVICAAAAISEIEFAAMFPSRRELLDEVGRTYMAATMSEVRGAVTATVSPAGKIERIVGVLAARDLAHRRLIAALKGDVWSGRMGGQRALPLHRAELAALVASLLGETVARRRRKPSDCGAAGEAVLAIYDCALDRAILADEEPDRLTARVAPQLRLLLAAFDERDGAG